MPSFRSLLLLHGYAFLFCYVFAVQAGAPLPADPLLLIMGAVIGEGRYSFGMALITSVIAAVGGDLLWYELGRRYGRRVLRVLCRFSLEPDTCVRQTELAYSRRGPWALLFTKFIPGSSLLSTPLAGVIKMPRWRFLLADAAGCALWTSAYLGAGALFHRQVYKLIALLGLFGRRAALMLVVLIGGYVLWRYIQRIRFRRQLRIDRMSPGEVHSMMNSDKPPMIVDLRAPVEVERTGQKILGAHVLRPAEVRSHFDELPADREVILYCT